MRRAEVDRTLQGIWTAARPKSELVLDLCREKSVLDLGCIDHSWQASIEDPHWLHGQIRAVAGSCTGVDYLEDDVRELNARGYDIVVGDVLKDSPPGKYEVVVAGDLIEHLTNPARFLEYVAEALEPNGVAVISTPNPFYLGQIWEILVRRKPWINPEHVSWFDPFTFTNLVERSPLTVRELCWLSQSWRPLWNMSGRMGRYARKASNRPTRWLGERRSYLRSDFAAVLEFDDGDPGFDPRQTAKDVNAFLGR